jgi:hypothetical protein
MFSGWVWLEMKKLPEMVWPEMVGHGWVSHRRRGEGEEEEKEKEKNQGKTRA